MSKPFDSVAFTFSHDFGVMHITNSDLKVFKVPAVTALGGKVLQSLIVLVKKYL